MHQKPLVLQPEWNIFVRELKGILNQYGLELDNLEDLVGLHPEKVHRLVRSLHTPQSLPALNTQEMKTLIAKLSLPEQDRLRLLASLLTNALQRTLILYLPANEARLAAEPLFRTILQVLKGHLDIGASNNVRTGDIEASEDNELDGQLAVALDAIDSGAEELQMSHFLPSQKGRVKKALQAHASFSTAIETLKHLSIDIQWQEGWQHWYSEACRGLSDTNQRLKELGE